jgi:hypothetical protein
MNHDEPITKRAPAAKERTFTMTLTPQGHMSRVLLDGDDISGLLRGVVVRSIVDDATTVELQPAKGRSRVELSVRLPEAKITLNTDHVQVGDRMRISYALLKAWQERDPETTIVIELAQVRIEADGTRTLVVDDVKADP